MEKRKLVLIVSSVISITLISGLVVTTISQANKDTYSNHDKASASTMIPIDKQEHNKDITYIPPILENNVDEVEISEPEDEVITFVPATEIDLDPTSITVLVNKEYCLPKDFRPKEMVVPKVAFDLEYFDERKLMHPEAAKYLEELFNQAKSEGVNLYGVSAYRSYQRQRSIFLSNIVKRGKIHTLQYSAVPGTSEHQTGLAIDVSSKALKFKLVASFATSPEGKWLSENAHHFGYIIRYPEGKEDITGYAYEPWHIRYVGKGLANYLYTNHLTLDEYYNYTPSEGFDFEALYADLINYKPPVVTEAPEDELTDEELVESGLDDLDENNLENPEEGEETEDKEIEDEDIEDEDIEDEDIEDEETEDEDIEDELGNNQSSDKDKGVKDPLDDGKVPTDNKQEGTDNTKESDGKKQENTDKISNDGKSIEEGSEPTKQPDGVIDSSSNTTSSLSDGTNVFLGTNNAYESTSENSAPRNSYTNEVIH